MRNRHLRTWFALAAALALSVPPLSASEQRRYPVQFRGVCQQCGHDLLAVYHPVECIGGGCDWQWVPVQHEHCRPVWKGRKKYDFFNSHLANPANPKRFGKKRSPLVMRTRCD